MVSLAVILRKSWIDVERLPFQQSIMAYELAKFSMGGRSKLLQSKAFAIGILLGIVIQLPIFLSYIYPWFPDIYGWRVNTCGTGAWYVPSDSPLLAIIGLSNIQKNPATYALLFLAPLKVLFNTWVWYIVYLILIQISWVEGFYTGMDTLNGCCRGYSGSHLADTPLWGPPFKFMALSFAGGFTALAVIYLFLNRAFLAQTLKAAIGKLSPDTVQELERNEALTYRQAWSLFALAFILNILIYAVVGVSPYSAFGPYRRAPDTVDWDGQTCRTDGHKLLRVGRPWEHLSEALRLAHGASAIDPGLHANIGCRPVGITALLPALWACHRVIVRWVSLR